jgi:predicted neutral ceramidase superfamily lipid hydrolase
MDWKQFLKPDWRKIVLTIVIFFIPMGLGFLIVLEGFAKEAGQEFLPFYILRIIIILLLILSPFSIILGFLPYVLKELLNLIFWYLLSCLIVWVYDKYKKQKK